MGDKVKQVVIIIAAVSILYLLLIPIMGIFTDAASTANTTIAATDNWSDFPGAQSALLGAPLFIFFIPAILGIAWVVLVLKRKER